MYDSEMLVKFLYEYSFHRQQRAENAMTEMMNNIKIFRFDQLDVLELLLSLNEYEVITEVCQDIRNIIKISKSPDDNKK